MVGEWTEVQERMVKIKCYKYRILKYKNVEMEPFWAWMCYKLTNLNIEVA